MAVFVWLALVFLGAIIAGMMLLAYVQVYIAFTAGIVTLGFGVWKQTSDIARNFFFAAGGKIFRLFTVLLIVAVIRFQLFGMGGVASVEDRALMIGMCVIFIMVLATVPATVGSIVAGGSSPAAENTVVEAATYVPREAAKKTAGAGLSTAGRGTNAAAAAGCKATRKAAGRVARAVKPGSGP